MFSAALYARVRLSTHCTRDRGCSAHPAFPAPSFLRDNEMQSSGRSCRENADVHLKVGRKYYPRHCERSEAIHHQGKARESIASLRSQ